MSTTSPVVGNRPPLQVFGFDQLPLATLTIVGCAPKSGITSRPVFITLAGVTWTVAIAGAETSPSTSLTVNWTV